MLRQFDETFPGWIGADFNHEIKGYRLSRAVEIERAVRNQMWNLKGITQITIDIVPVGDGFYKVVNRSTYETDY